MSQPAPTSAYEPINRSTPADFTDAELARVGQPETLLEELQMVRLEGRYFCFDKHEAKARTGVLEYRDGNRGLIIEVSARFGHPSLLAYKVLQAVFKKITEAGKPYPDTVVLGQRELGRLVGRESFGGRDAQQLHQAISQLRNTNVELYLYEDDKDSKDDKTAGVNRVNANASNKAFKTWSFSILANLGFVGKGDATHPQHIHAAVLRLDPTIADNLRAGHFAIYNWDRLAGMEPLTAALYKRLYLHLSNLYETQYHRANLKFEKDYETICEQWLGGLKPERYKSRIAHQLQAHFDMLQVSGLVREVLIEPKVKGGFKLVFKPGEGFFADYESFYFKAPNSQKSKAFLSQSKESLAEASTPNNPSKDNKANKERKSESELLAPMQAVAYFYQNLHGVPSTRAVASISTSAQADHIYAERDVAFATSMIQKLGVEGFTELINFAIQKAPLTRFAMQSIRAVETYLSAWQIANTKLAEHKQQQNIKNQAQRQETLQAAYSKYCEAAREKYATTLSEIEHQNLHQEALAIVLPQSPVHSKTHRLMLTITKRNLIAKRVTVPNFEAWLALCGMSESDIL